MATFTGGSIASKENPNTSKNIAGNGSGAAVATVDSYQPAVGKMALVRFFSLANFAGGAPTVALQFNFNAAGNRTVVSGAAALAQVLGIWVTSSDTVKVAVTALAAGSTFDYVLAIEEYDAF